MDFYQPILVLLLPLPPTFVTLRTYKPPKQGCMQIPVEPNLDKPIPVVAQKQAGKTLSERMKIAGNTALLLKELGVEENVTPEEDAQAKAMFAKMDDTDDTATQPGPEEASMNQIGVAMKLGSYISEYEKQVVADKIQVRTVVINRLMEISKDEDNRTALKALELLGKASDLFTERAEITITHQTSDELKSAIKERINQLMQMQKLDNKSKTESRLAQLKHSNEDVVDVEAKEK